MASPRRVPAKSTTGLNSMASSMMGSLPHIPAAPYATSTLRIKNARSDSFSGDRDAGSAALLTAPKDSKSALAPLPTDEKGLAAPRKYQRRQSEGSYLPSSSKPLKSIPKLKSKSELGGAASKKKLSSGRRSSRNLQAAAGEGGAMGRSVGSLPPISLAQLRDGRPPSSGADSFV